MLWNLLYVFFFTSELKCRQRMKTFLIRKFCLNILCLSGWAQESRRANVSGDEQLLGTQKPGSETTSRGSLRCRDMLLEKGMKNIYTLSRWNSSTSCPSCLEWCASSSRSFSLWGSLSGSPWWAFNPLLFLSLSLGSFMSDVLVVFWIPFLLTKSMSPVPCYHNGVPNGL